MCIRHMRMFLLKKPSWVVRRWNLPFREYFVHNLKTGLKVGSDVDMKIHVKKIIVNYRSFSLKV